ncbi:MAG: YvcK family protein, partial [Planctomycetes bacterium]|nr:YvcK family protein [Planctomycetota bacterium]
GLDIIYLGDDEKEKGNDYPAFEKVGFGRAVSVSGKKMEEVPEGLRQNYVGGLEQGVRDVLRVVVERAKANPQAELFDEEGIRAMVSRVRELRETEKKTHAAGGEISSEDNSNADRGYRRVLTGEEKYLFRDNKGQAEDFDTHKVMAAREIIDGHTVTFDELGAVDLGEVVRHVKVKFFRASSAVPNSTIDDAEQTVYVFARNQESIHPRLLARMLLHESVARLFREANIVDQIHERARKAERVLGAVILGGPDGVILPYGRKRDSTLLNSPTYDSFLKLLYSGYDVVLVTNQMYTRDPNTGQDGIYERLIQHIEEGHRRNLTLFVSGGAIKIEFDELGRAIFDERFNQRNKIEQEDLAIIRRNAEKIVEEYWFNFSQSPQTFRNRYRSFRFNVGRPKILEHRIGEDVFAISIVYWPSIETGVFALPLGELDEREKAIQKLRSIIRPGNLDLRDEYSLGKAGFTTIDIHRNGSGKAEAVERYLRGNNIRPGESIFIGNLGRYSEDEVFDRSKRLEHRFFNDTDKTEREGFVHAGHGVASVSWWLRRLSEEGVTIAQLVREITSCLEQGEHPALRMTIIGIREYVTAGGWRASLENRIYQLWKIYQENDLRYTNQAAWTRLYLETYKDRMPLLLVKAFLELIERFREAEDIDGFFRIADEIYEQNREFLQYYYFDYYMGVDPRVALNVIRLKELIRIVGEDGNEETRVYDNDEEIRQDIVSVQETTGLPVARILSGYFQDGYIYAHKKTILSGGQARAPPVVLTTIGGGGPATTDFMMSLASRGMRNVSAVVSSSDSGGASMKVMMALWRTFGFPFIPPGDAAGLMIKLSGDILKSYALFDSELKGLGGKRLDHNINSVLLEWQKRLMDVRRKVREGKIPVSKDFIMFASGLLVLGEMIDRELIGKVIRKNEEEFKDMSTANLIFIGAAYDMGIIRYNRGMPNYVVLENLNRFLGLTNQRAIPVSYDYERSALLATFEDGSTLFGQTKITDLIHALFITGIRFVHHLDGRKEYQELAVDGYPSSNSEADKAIQGTVGAVLMGNGSPITSLLPNLLYPRVATVLLETRARGVPVVYIAKIKTDIETSKGIRVQENRLIVEAQLDLLAQLEMIRRHVSTTLGREVALNEIISHVIIPDLSKELYIALNEVHLDSSILERLSQGEAQISKYVQGIQPFSPEDVRRYEEELGRLGIVTVKVGEEHIVGKESQKPMYENEHLIDVIEGIVGRPLLELQAEMDNEMGGDSSQKAHAAGRRTMLSKEMVDNFVRVGGAAIREFLGEVGKYEGAREESPYKDIAGVENVWAGAREYKQKPEEFSDERLVRRGGMEVPRIEVRGLDERSGEAAQVAVIG